MRNVSLRSVEGPHHVSVQVVRTSRTVRSLRGRCGHHAPGVRSARPPSQGCYALLEQAVVTLVIASACGGGDAARGQPPPRLGLPGPGKPGRGGRRRACSGPPARLGWPASRRAWAVLGIGVKHRGPGRVHRRLSALTPTPQRRVKTTLGGDSQFDPPAIHSVPPAYPQARKSLAAPPSGASWHTGGTCRGGSDPPPRGLGAA